MIEHTRRIKSNSERSEEFLVKKHNHSRFTPKTFRTVKKMSKILTTMNALAKSRGKDIKSEMKSPELSKY